MSGVSGIVQAVGVVILFALMLYAGYYAQDQFDLPSFFTDLMPAGMVEGWNDKTIVLPDVEHSASLWQGSQVLAGELEATAWVNENTNASDKFVADIGGAEVIMGMTTRVSLVGGDWANSPDPVYNMELAGRIYSSTNASDARDLAKNASCTYVWLPDRQLNTGTYNDYASTEKFNDTSCFELVYSQDQVSIYKVLP